MSALRILPTPPGVEVPTCAHGPALLFETASSASALRRFFACAGCRERRSCPLFVPADASGRPLHSKQRRHRTSSSQPSPSRAAILARSRRLARLRPSDLSFCRTCQVLTTPPEHERLGHDLLKAPCVRHWARQPSRLLTPRTANAENAQFLFDNASLVLLLGAIRRSGATLLLCLGCPRLHEAILRVRRRCGAERWPDSLLLDLDERFGAFFGGRRYRRYNMFNHHFLGPSEGAIVGEKHRVLIVCDPPYGGLLQALASTLERLQEALSGSQVVGHVLVLPYFMEKKVKEFLPHLRIFDFPISYENHRKFSPGSSPARLFSNLSPSILRPSRQMAPLFHFCSTCQRHSALTNRHCVLCGFCPTRYGATYKHCMLCRRCVKQSWRHCSVCNFCVQPLKHCCGRGSEA